MSHPVRNVVFVANLLYAALLLVLGLLPNLPAFATGVSDHAAHALAYAVQAGLLFALFLPSGGRGMAALLAAGVAGLYGGFVETLQFLQPERTFEYIDLGVNFVGAGMAASMAFFLTRPREARTGL
jgi:VanZ family protein